MEQEHDLQLYVPEPTADKPPASVVVGFLVVMPATEATLIIRAGARAEVPLRSNGSRLILFWVRDNVVK